MISRNAFSMFLLLAAVAPLTSCQPSTGGLAERVVSFVRTAGDLNQSKQYLTPLMQQSLEKVQTEGAGIALPGAAPILQRLTEPDRLAITADNVRVRSRGKWAQARITITSEMGNETVDTIWLNVEGQWYLYSGTGGEQNEYGSPPYFTN